MNRRRESARSDAPRDLTDRAYWDGIYSRGARPGQYWRPRSYAARTIADVFERVFAESEISSVLEVGCGASRWLPYLARTFDVRAAGIDYAPIGAELARERLAAAGVDGRIITADVCDVSPEEVGVFDLVYSLGVVEHFESPERILKAMRKLVAPGGLLVTEVPNLRSVHGLLMRLYQPSVFNRHVPLTADDLARAYANLDMREIECGYRGLFASILSLGVDTRWPRVFRLLDPLLEFGVKCSHLATWPLAYYGGVQATAPYVIAVGRRPLNGTTKN